MLCSDTASSFQLEFPDASVTPIAGANELCRLLWAAHYDAFCMSNSAALLFMRSTKSFQATVVVLGERVAPESQRSSNSCTAVFGDKNNVHYYSMVTFLGFS